MPELLLGTVIATGYAMAAWRLGLTLQPLPDTKTLQQLQAAAPPWVRGVSVVQQVWIWSELVVLLTNERRRALHDFIAGTVVIRHDGRRVIRADGLLPVDGAWRERAPR